MRDLDKMREKTVLMLDSRQLFFLFFGGSVAAALVFALGVIVGRRLPATETTPEEDPLAMLDQLGAEEETLSFQKGLKGRAAAPLPRPAPEAPSSEAGANAPEPPGSPRHEPEPAVAAPVAAAQTPAPADPPMAPQAAAPGQGSPSRRRSASPPAPSDAAPSDDSGRFTLQLSSFQEKDEAAEFMKVLEGKGYQTYLISAEVPGRGLWYRVRLGDYANHDEALEAKAEFERKQRIIAYVLRR